VMQLGMQPSVLPHPTTCAMVSVKLRLDPGGPRLLYALLDFLLRGYDRIKRLADLRRFRPASAQTLPM
jgi:hypothetical protein